MYRCARGPPKRSRPLAMRRLVFSVSGFLRYFGSSRRERPGLDQSIISRAARHLGSSWSRLGLPVFEWVASGHRMGFPSFRACRKKRIRVVASP